MSIKCERKYKHSKEELELTKVVKIPQNPCKENEIPIFIHSAARSSGKYYDRRQTTRQTWVKEAIDEKMKPIFVIGLPEDRKTQKELKRESKKYKDMIQFGFNDNYYNLTLKAISILRWVTNNCMTSDYVLKTDDDVLVNVDRFKRMVDDKQFSSGLTGRMLRINSNRRPGNKWYMPEDLYTSDRYQFLFGFSYVMSKNVIKKLLKTVDQYSGPVLDIDDVFMTGVIADKARVRKFNSYMFGEYCGYNDCHLHNMLVIHGCDSVNGTLDLWNSWKKTSSERCRRFGGYFWNF